MRGCTKWQNAVKEHSYIWWKNTLQTVIGWITFNKSVESLFKINKDTRTCDSLSVQLLGGGVGAVSIYISVYVALHFHPFHYKGKQFEAGRC